MTSGEGCATGRRRVIPIVPAPPAFAPAPAANDGARAGRTAAPARARSESLYRSEAKIQPRAVHGWFARWRWALVWATQLVFYGLAWLPWNGRQALLFDLQASRFYLFGLVLHPQDVVFLAGLLIVCALGLFLFTAVAGRLWCGYACPQTVYTEIFLWIEQRCEGDRMARLRLDAAPWSARKLLRRGAKHAAWGAVALWTGFTFVGYFTPIRTLAAEAGTFALGGWEVFWVLFYGFATYGNAGWMREQVCKYMCPYARFQSAMFDHDTLVIGYDARRGEPRGAPLRAGGAATAAGGAGTATTPERGDCVDCGLCVQVCPTGIDIRQGLQYACIGCAACIDVCDGVMAKLGRAAALVRYDSETGLAQGAANGRPHLRLLRPRVLFYGAALLALATGLVVALLLRPAVRADVVRDRNALARMVEQGRIENVYRIQLMNTTESEQHVAVAVEGLPGAVLAAPAEAELAPAQDRWLPVQVQLSPEAAQALGPGVHPLRFRVTARPVLPQAFPTSGPEAVVREKSTFVVPR